MREYPIISILSILITLLLDRALKTNILKKREFYIFLLVILFFTFLLNGYLTRNDIFMYNRKFYLGIRIGSIPLEDFFFGFSMVSLTIIFWEFFKEKIK